MVCARILHPVSEEVHDRSQNFLDRLLVKHLATHTLTILQDGITPFVIGRVRVIHQVLRQPKLSNPTKSAKLLTGDFGLLCLHVARFAD
jgi:hypothetical protein